MASNSSHIRRKPSKSELPRPPKTRFRLFPVWFRLGLVSFRRSFWCGRFSCDGGGRDFAYLTLLLTLVTALALLLVASRSNFLDRMTDALLGTLRPHGVPVWVTSHWQNHDGISRETIAQVEKLKAQYPELTVHPYRRLEASRPRIRLPGTNSWSVQPKFVGWGVYPSDPLWQLAQDVDTQPETPEQWLGLPLEVVLNAQLFAKHFDYRTYRDELKRDLPASKRHTLPDQIDRDHLADTLKVLWLRLTVGQEEHLFPFNIRWMNHIPAMEQVAYLFPLSTYHGLLAAYHLPDLKFDPAGQGMHSQADARRLKSSSYPRQAIVEHVSCIRKAVDETGLTGIPMIHDGRCAPPAGMDPNAPSSGVASEWDLLEHDSANQLWLPCHRLARNDTVRGTICPGSSRRYRDKAPLYIPWDVTGYGTAYASLHVYVKPENLRAVIDSLSDLRVESGQRAFNIHPKYQDALNRFNMLNDVLTHFVPAFALTMGTLLTALLLAQIGTLLDHRKHHYGMLMTRGMTWTGIHAKVYLQMTLAVLISGSIALGGTVELLKIYLGRHFAEVMSQYRELLNPSIGLGIDNLSMPWLAFGMTLGGVYVAVILVTFFLLFRLPLRWGAAPSDLLHGEGGIIRKR
uniref:Uncharacterized protein n=1 Tax=Magnetococcus massalia (strain MO-1) TaxID=451514 RepID=A0A1S7LC20_MAGMO|nr:Conserved membrane protein of unknown function [Candidatus Magnetococcus massalia]